MKFYLQKIRQDLLQKEVSCPDEGTLTKYYEETLAKKKMEEIRSHVAVCDFCIDRIKQIDRNSDSPKTESLISPEIIREDWQKFERRINKDKNRWGQARIIFSLAASIVIILTALAGGLYLTRPDYYSLAKIDQENELKKLSTFRGTSQLSQGIFALKERDFNRANGFFIDYINEKPDTFDGHYYSGLTYLFKAESGLVGFFRFRKSYVEKAVAHLQKALTRIDNNERQAANCYWFLGKAHLMKDQIELAKSEFKKILVLFGANIKRKKDAELILSEIENL